VHAELKTENMYERKIKKKWSSRFPSGLNTESHVQSSPELILQHLFRKEWWLQLNLRVSQFEEFHMVQPVGKTKMILTSLPQMKNYKMCEL